MNDNVMVVFHGFLSLQNLEKLQLVNAINEYFDSNDKEAIRARHEDDYAKFDLTSSGRSCGCCGR